MQPVVVFDRNGNMRSHAIWENNPRIARKWDRVSPVHSLRNGPGVRPYIAEKTQERWVWKDFKCPVGEIYFSDEEKAYADKIDYPFVVIEPNCKAKASPNKDWGRARWQRLADLLAKQKLNVLQLWDPGTHILRGVTPIYTESFRMACAVLAKAGGAVLPEGGLHHAAAAVGVRAVVIYGGYISPRQTGYDIHSNLFTGGEPCGMRILCDHCKKAMADIEPEMVLQRFMEGIKNA